MSSAIHLAASSTEARPLSEILTPRELEAGKLLAQGMTNKAIASAMEICEGSAKQRVSAIYQKLGRTTRVELARRFMSATTNSAPSPALCTNCRVLLDPPKQAKFEEQATRIGDQMWRCPLCLTRRAWGMMEPWDSQMRPALHCADCDQVTRHKFVCVA
jgi:DNA-binding CsgD family transcriptional regulator